MLNYQRVNNIQTIEHMPISRESHALADDFE